MQMIHCEMVMDAMRDEAIVEYTVKKAGEKIPS